MTLRIFGLVHRGRYLPSRLLCAVATSCCVLLIVLPSGGGHAQEASNVAGNAQYLTPTLAFEGVIKADGTAPRFRLRLESRSDVKVTFTQRTAAKCLMDADVRAASGGRVSFPYDAKRMPDKEFVFSGEAWGRYSLEKGDYELELTCRSGSYPPSNPDVAFTIEYASTSLVDLPPEMRAFERWLDETGLGKAMRVDGFYRVGENQIISTTTSPWVSGEESATATKKYLTPGGFNRPKTMPKLSLVLVMSSGLDRDKWMSFLQKAETTFEDNLLGKLVRTAAAFAGVPKERVAIPIQAYCWSAFAYIDKRKLNGSASVCASSSHAVELNDLGVHLSSPAAEPMGATIKIIPDIEQRLKSYFGAKGGEMQVLDRDDGYLEVIARKTKGVVIQGNQDWEKTQLAISLITTGNTRRLRIHADGFLGSGFSAPSSDQGYDRSMEPLHAKTLSDFVKSLATQLKIPGKKLD